MCRQQTSKIFPRLGLLCWDKSSRAAPIVQCLELQMWLLLVLIRVRPAHWYSNIFSNNQQNVRPRPWKHFFIFREAPSAIRSDCYLNFPHTQGGKFSKITKCLSVDDEPPGRWLTSALDITPDMCDDFKTFTQRKERLSKVSVQRRTAKWNRSCLNRHN